MVIEPSATDRMHWTIGLHEVCRIDFMAFVLGRDAFQHQIGNGIVRAAGPHCRLHVRLLVAEQAIAKLAVGG